MELSERPIDIQTRLHLVRLLSEVNVADPSTHDAFWIKLWKTYNHETLQDLLHGAITDKYA